MQKSSGILITGGYGFIGSNLAKYYLNQQVPVLCVDNLSTSYLPNKTFLETRYSSHLKTVIADVVQPWDQWISDVSEDVISEISHVFFYLLRPRLNFSLKKV